MTFAWVHSTFAVKVVKFMYGQDTLKKMGLGFTLKRKLLKLSQIIIKKGK